MRCGLKLNVGFERRPAYRALFQGREILPCLTAFGVQAVEAPMGPETVKDALLEHVGRCAKHGLLVSLHPYSEGGSENPKYFADEDGNVCRDVHERYLRLAADAACLQRGRTVVNIHGAADWLGDRPEMFQRSVQFFTWARRWCEHHAPDVEVVAELQIGPASGEVVVRIGDTYEELLQLGRQSGVRLCWDMGHAAMNARRRGDPLDPRDDFYAHVAHVHCHDVNGHDQNGGDHWPLLFGNVPWERFVGRLRQAGFDGTLLLEVTPDRFLAGGGLESLERSIQLLRDAIGAQSLESGV